MSEQNKTNKILLWIVVGVLIALNALFISNYLTTKEEKKKVETELASTEDARKALEKQYADVNAQLEEFKGKNEKLNTLVEQQKKELDEKVADLRRRLQKEKLDQAELDKAMADIRRLSH